MPNPRDENRVPTIGGQSTSTSASIPITAIPLSGVNALTMALVDNTGAQINSFGGGTQYADGTTQATPTGTTALGKNASNVLHALSLDGSGNLNVNIAAGSAAGGTSSSFGAAFPASGTAVGATDGTNMRQLQVESSTVFNLRTGIWSGSTQATVTAGNALKVDGSAVTQPVSGTVTSNIGTTNGLALDATLAKLNVAQSAALGTNTGPLIQASVTTAAPTYTTGNINPLSLTTAGALRVDGSAVTQPVSGTVTANAGTGTFTVSGTVSANQGTANTTANAWPQKVTDGTNTAAVKAASTAAAATDPALVVAVSPNNTVAVTESGTWNVGLNAGSNIIGKVGIDQTTLGSTNGVTPVPASNSGWSFNYQSALTNSVVQIKGTAGTFGGYLWLYNPNTAVTYIQIFNKASASVTLGTTAPDFVIALPGVASASATGSAANMEMVMGIAMGTGISLAATTTATGSTAPTNTLSCTFLFK